MEVHMDITLLSDAAKEEVVITSDLACKLVMLLDRVIMLGADEVIDNPEFDALVGRAEALDAQIWARCDELNLA
jgi:hypothetical protein